MQERLSRCIVTAMVLFALALGGAGCDFDDNDESGTRVRVLINLLPDDGKPGGATIHFQTDL